jgi:dTDP-4-dehydrorhamnose 3,5-epimerase
MINGVFITPLKIIDTKGGNVLHSLKDKDPGFKGFGEAYFSEVQPCAIKAWKLHQDMTLNLTVPVGKVRFVLYDDRDKMNSEFQELIISRKNYVRLTVPPMIWLGFQGLSDANSLILNIADIPHNPKESIRKDINEIYFDWSK